MNKDYIYIMLTLVTIKEASSCNFADTSLQERRNRKLFIKLINCQVNCYTSLLFELQIGHFNSSVLKQSLFSDHKHHPQQMWTLHATKMSCRLSEATSVSPSKCSRKQIPHKCLSSHLSHTLCCHPLIFVREFRHTKEYLVLK